MKCLVYKVNEIEVLLGIDNKYYTSLFEYFNFYIDNYLLRKDDKLNEINVTEEIKKILFLVKNIKFNQAEAETKSFVINVLQVLSSVDLDNQLQIFDSFNELKYKATLPLELFIGIYKIYINAQIEKNQIEKANGIIKNIIEIIKPNTKEEVDFFILNLFILLQKNEDEGKIKEMCNIIFEHKELGMEEIEGLMIKFSRFSSQHIFIELFSRKISEMKNLKFANTRIVLNFDTIKKYSRFSIIFLYLFFNYSLQNEATLKEILSPNLLELLKNTSESLLDNVVNKVYSSEESQQSNFEYLIPTILHNIITLFLKYDETDGNFANYFLIEIIKKGKDCGISYLSDFIEMSIDIYIEKKDFPKLKLVLKEMEESKAKNSLFYYANIILLIGEGLKWSSVNIIQTFCQDLNNCADFTIETYLKVFNYIYSYNIQDVSLFSILLMNYISKFNEFFSKENFDEKKLKVVNEDYKQYGMFNCFFEVLYYSSKMNNFQNHIINFIDIFEITGNLLENYLYSPDNNPKDKYITSSIGTVIDLIKLMIELKNSKIFISDAFPDNILISLCKMMNFVFLNFKCYLEKEFFEQFDANQMSELQTYAPLILLFELFQNLKVFHISFEFNSLKSDPENKENQKFFVLNNRYKNYSNNFQQASQVLFSFIPKESPITKEINEKITAIAKSSETVEQILGIQLLLKTNTKEKIREEVFNILNNSYQNKKLIFIVNSILFQCNFPELSFEFLGQLLNKILMTNAQEIFNKVYFVDDILSIFKDYVSIINEEKIEVKIQSLKEYQVFLSKLTGKIDEAILCENIEWIFYQVYKIFEIKNLSINSEVLNTLKSIYTELNSIYIRNKSLILSTLSEIILKRII